MCGANPIANVWYYNPKNGGLITVTANGNFESTKQKIRQWLTSGHATAQDIPDQGKVWAMLARFDAESIPLVVSMVLRDPDIVSVSINIEMDAYLSNFNQLAAAEKRDLLFDLRIALVQRENLGFDVPNTLSPINLNVALFLEELTKATLLRTFDKIENSFRLVEFILNKRFGIDSP